MSFIASIIGIIALVLLSREGSSLSFNFGWIIVFLLLMDFSATSALKKDMKENGFNHNTPVTKSWIVIGLISEILIIALSVYVFLYN